MQPAHAPQQRQPREQKRPLGIRLVTASLLASLIVAIIVSAVQIYFIYQTEISEATGRFSQIEASNLGSLADNLWEVNINGVDELLEGIARLPDVGKLVLTDELGQKIIKNPRNGSVFAHREFTLYHQQADAKFEVGHLEVDLINDDIIADLKSRTSQIVITILLALLVNALLVLFLLRHMIVRHLVKMARYAADFDLSRLGTPLQLDRPTSSHGSDELDLVINAINNMQTHLQQELLRRATIEQELRDHQEKLELLVEERSAAYKTSAMQLEFAANVAGLGVWTLNLQDDSVEWNERMFEIYQQPPASPTHPLTLDSWSQRVHPDDIELVLRQLDLTISTQSLFDTKFRIITAKGQHRHIHARAQAIADASGKNIAVIGINHDITDQMELQRRLVNAKENADAASAAKSSFLANMSHEIRTPMNAIMGMLQLVQQTELNNRQRDYLVKAHSAAKSLLGLLNDILDYSKIEAGKMLLDPHPFSLEILMHDLANVLPGNQGEKRVEILFELDPALPAELIGDALRLQQILINLAGNALKFTDQGYVLIRLSQLSRHGDTITLQVSVEDTGIGITPEQQSRIFRGFEQAESSTTRRFGGTGLGLVICRRLIALMGGELQLHSEAGKGSRFWFDIELKIANDVPLTTTYPLPDNPLNLLVVDDNFLAGEILVRALEGLGWRAQHVSRGELAISALRKAQQLHQSFDVVIMDWSMPGLDGLTTAKAIQQDNYLTQPPVIIMLTAYGQEVLADAQEQDNPPFRGFLTKPVTPQQLANAVLRGLTGVKSPPQKSNVPVSHMRLEGLRLLVVEDNALNRQVASELLSSEGAQVTLAEGGIEGVDKATTTHPLYDLVIMDIQMPDIDGLEATRRIRDHDHCQKLPILAMTANASQTDRENCLAAGMNSHIGKPIDLDEVVHEILALVRPQQETNADVESVQSVNVASSIKPNQADAVTDSVPERTEPDNQAGVQIEATASILRRFGGKATLFLQVLGSFEPEMTRLLDELNTSIDQLNAPNACAALHTIKGVSSTMGATTLTTRVAELETLLKTGVYTDLSTLLNPGLMRELQSLLNSSLHQLRAIELDT